MVITLIWAAAAYAADPTFAGTDKAGQKFDAPVNHLSALFGGTLATGNTEFYNLAAGLDAGREWNRNKLGVTGHMLFGRGYVDLDGNGSISDAERDAGRVKTAQQLTADMRYDRFFGELNSAYALAGLLADPFAGYDLRTHEQLGYSRRLVHTDKTELLAELGIDDAQEDYVKGVDPNHANIVAARGMASIHQVLGEGAALDVKVEAYEDVQDVEDLRVLTNEALTAKISGMLALQVGHTLAFDNVPVDGFRKTDQTVTASLVATIF